MKTISAIETSDGEVFTSREEAEKHEMFLQTQDAVEAFIGQTYKGENGKMDRGDKANSTRARSVLFAFIGWLHDNNLTVGSENRHIDGDPDDIFITGK